MTNDMTRLTQMLANGEFNNAGSNSSGYGEEGYHITQNADQGGYYPLGYLKGHCDSDVYYSSSSNYYSVGLRGNVAINLHCSKERFTHNNGYYQGYFYNNIDHQPGDAFMSDQTQSQKHRGELGYFETTFPVLVMSSSNQYNKMITKTGTAILNGTTLDIIIPEDQMDEITTHAIYIVGSTFDHYGLTASYGPPQPEEEE